MIAFAVIILFIFFIAFVANSNTNDTSATNTPDLKYTDESSPIGIDMNEITKENSQNMDLEDIAARGVASIVNATNVENYAKALQTEQGINKREAFYFSGTSLYTTLLVQNIPNKKEMINKLIDIIKNKCPEIYEIFLDYNPNNFDFIEHIASNARIIRLEEGKDVKEATYLTICMIFDDLAQRRSQKGHQELMNIVKTVYPEQLNEVMTYLAWKYEPKMDFKPEFDEYMRKRHSK